MEGKLRPVLPFAFLYTLLGAVLILVMLLAVSVGAVDIPGSWIVKILVNQILGREFFPRQWPDPRVSILWQLRVPKVAAAVCIGASLSLSGIMMQAITKNPLADPFVLGVSSGASTGAVAAILLGGLPFIGSFPPAAGAFGGALLASVLVFLLADGGKNPGATRLVLTGMAMAAIFGAVTNLLIFMTPDTHKINSALFWMTGSLAGIGWKELFPAVLAFLTGFASLGVMHRSLDVLLLGEERALTIGVDIKRLKYLLIILSSLLTGIMVSLSGVIGFVGLVVPHVSRTLLGPVHKRLIPLSVLLGAIFMVLADILARLLARPEEMPIGIITALTGAPFFMILLRRSNYKFGE
jgi:iron complex transport system permease protein